MYSLYDLYKDIMAGKKSSFTYEGIEESIIANEYEFKADGTRF